MADNILDLNEFRKKKAEADKQKSATSQEFEEQYFDDDDDFSLENPYFSPEDVDRVLSTSFQEMFQEMIDALLERDTYDDPAQYIDELGHEVAELQVNEPDNDEDRIIWEHDLNYYQRKLMLVSMADYLIARCGCDDNEIREKIKEGSLKESDLLIDDATLGTDLWSYIPFFTESKVHFLADRNDDTSDEYEYLWQLRRVVYTIKKHLNDQYEDLIANEPPENKTLQHNRWEDNVESNLIKQYSTDLTKGFLLLLSDMVNRTSNHPGTSQIDPDLLQFGLGQDDNFWNAFKGDNYWDDDLDDDPDEGYWDDDDDFWDDDDDPDDDGNNP
ncbi:MAG: hypothetical protein IJ242_12645 [Clostridia bacterium]|nr:hypothetical protein [Clostridia bacterium]